MEVIDVKVEVIDRSEAAKTVEAKTKVRRRREEDEMQGVAQMRRSMETLWGTREEWRQEERPVAEARYAGRHDKQISKQKREEQNTCVHLANTSGTNNE